MAEVQLASVNDITKWRSDFFTSYTRQTGFAPYMGRTASSIIRIVSDLEASAGTSIVVPLILELRGRGVEGAEVLEGNEEEMDNFGDRITVNWKRNGVVVPKSTSYKTEIDLLGAARDRLKIWNKNNLRDAIINAFQSIIIPGTVDADGNPGTDTPRLYALSTAAERNTYLANNIDRILFGNLYANSVSANWATALGTIDSVNDRMSARVIQMAKSLAKRTTTNPNGMAINPYQSDATAGREWYVMFMGTDDFNNASRDPLISQADRDARERGVDTNPIFQGGDRIYEGVILREIPELRPLVGAGAGGVDVGRSFLAGAGALGVAWGQTPTPRTDTDRDFKFRPAVAIEELRGQKKISFNGINYGVVEVLTAAVPLDQ
jgi:hypothetical protein